MTKHDLVERLRDITLGIPMVGATVDWPNAVMKEAADEIEKLRAEIARITDHVAGTLLPKINAQREVVERIQGEKSAWETLCKELEATVFKARGTLAVVEAAREVDAKYFSDTGNTAKAMIALRQTLNPLHPRRRPPLDLEDD